MTKWLKIGGALILLLWLPFLYAELTSAPLEKKGRALPSEDPSAEPVAEPRPGEPEEPAAEAKPEEQKPAAAAPEPALQKTAEPPSEEPTPSPAAGEPSDEAQADDKAAEEPPPPPTAAGPAAVLKHAFETQPRDPLWAGDSERKLKALVGGDVPAELLQSATCRNAVCKIELRWTADRAAAYVSFYEAAHKQLGGEVGVEPQGTPDDKGLARVDLYLARKGYTVADLSK
jgi:hypothetical protein